MARWSPIWTHARKTMDRHASPTSAARLARRIEARTLRSTRSAKGSSDFWIILLRALPRRGEWCARICPQLQRRLRVGISPNFPPSSTTGVRSRQAPRAEEPRAPRREMVHRRGKNQLERSRGYGRRRARTMRCNAMAAPKPLSMLHTVIPDAHDVSMPSSAAYPPAPAP